MSFKGVVGWGYGEVSIKCVVGWGIGDVFFIGVVPEQRIIHYECVWRANIAKNKCLPKFVGASSLKMKFSVIFLLYIIYRFLYKKSYHNDRDLMFFSIYLFLTVRGCGHK